MVDHNTLLIINTLMVFFILIILMITGYLAYPIYKDYLRIMENIDEKKNSGVASIIKSLFDKKS